MSTLNREFVLNEWVPALRSGEYRQGRKYLRSDEGFCCLGVACDLLVKKGVLPDWENARLSFVVAQNDQYLPGAAYDYIGTTRAGRFDDDVVIAHWRFPNLAEANDAGVTFGAIADWLEAEYGQAVSE